MSLRIVLAASAVLAFAAPAFAQDAPAAPPAAAEAPSAAALELEAKGEAFKARMTLMQGEIEAAITGAGSDQAKGLADVDAILARYQPDIDGLIVAFDAFIDAEAASAPDEATKTEMQEAKTAMRTALSGLPAQVRGAAQSALAAQAAAPAAAPVAAPVAE
ncbi:MAG: translation initiation factor IF-2 [Caulobacterales bacterium]|nr:translation initiation factor IF-2 [Caulobacterales bacterium]